jgi:hypothetical protein
MMNGDRRDVMNEEPLKYESGGNKTARILPLAPSEPFAYCTGALCVYKPRSCAVGGKADAIIAFQFLK